VIGKAADSFGGSTASLLPMGSRARRVFTEAYRFLAVGGLASIVAFLLFNLLVHGFHLGFEAPLSGQPYFAFVIANLVGMFISYRGSRSWVFRDRPPQTADGGRLLFIIINLGTMLIPIACLWFSRNVLGLDDPFSDNIAASVIGLFLGMMARFYLFRTLVFRKPVVLAELKQHPLQVFELSELQEEDPFIGPTDRSTIDRAPQQAP
jgi:putative flippase GtrA